MGRFSNNSITTFYSVMVNMNPLEMIGVTDGTTIFVSIAVIMALGTITFVFISRRRRRLK